MRESDNIYKYIANEKLSPGNAKVPIASLFEEGPGISKTTGVIFPVLFLMGIILCGKTRSELEKSRIFEM